MGLNADNGLSAAKPYISSANYNKRTSGCPSVSRFKARERLGEWAYLYSYLYWNFHLGYEGRLRANPRMSRSVLQLQRFGEDEADAILSQS
jgi:deoxyribodipyrimidine photolyase-like uncharacterized protein